MSFIIIDLEHSRRVERIIHFDRETAEEHNILDDYPDNQFETIEEEELKGDIYKLKGGEIIKEDGTVDKDEVTKKRYILKKEIKIGEKKVDEEVKTISVDSELSSSEEREAEEKLGKIQNVEEYKASSSDKIQFLKERKNRLIEKEEAI